MNHSFLANEEMLAVAAWLARQPSMQGVLAQRQHALEESSGKRIDVEGAMQALLDEEVVRVERVGGIYGNVYRRLLQHRLAWVDLDTVKAALQGDHGLALRPGYRPFLLKDQAEEAQRSDTAVFKDALIHDSRLLARLCQIRQGWYGNVDVGGRVLCALFSLTAPLLLCLRQCAPFVPDFLHTSLRRVEWEHIAEFVLEASDPSLVSDTVSDPTAETPLALLKGQIWQALTVLSESPRQAAFSPQVQHLCHDLALHCIRAHESLCELEANGLAIPSR